MIDATLPPQAKTGQLQKISLQVRNLDLGSLRQVVTKVIASIQQGVALNNYSRDESARFPREFFEINPAPAESVKSFYLQPNRLSGIQYIDQNSAAVFGLQETRQILSSIARHLELYNRDLLEKKFSENPTQRATFERIALFAPTQILLTTDIERDAKLLLDILSVVPSEAEEIEEHLPPEIEVALQQDPISAWPIVSTFLDQVKTATVGLELQTNVTSIHLFGGKLFALYTVRSFFNQWLDKLFDFSLQQRAALGEDFPVFPLIQKFTVSQDAPFSASDLAAISFIDGDVRSWIMAYQAFLLQQQPQPEQEAEPQEEGTVEQTGLETKTELHKENPEGPELETDEQARLQQLVNDFQHAGTNYRLTAVRLNNILLPELLAMRMPGLSASLVEIRMIDPAAYYEMQYFFSLELEQILRTLTSEQIAALSKPGGFTLILQIVSRKLMLHQSPQLQAAMARFVEVYRQKRGVKPEEQAEVEFTEPQTEDEINHALDLRTESIRVKEEELAQKGADYLPLAQLRKYTYQVGDTEAFALLTSAGIKNPVQQQWLLTTINIAKTNQIPVEILTHLNPSQFEAIFGFPSQLNPEQLKHLGTALYELSFRTGPAQVIHNPPSQEKIKQLSQKETAAVQTENESDLSELLDAPASELSAAHTQKLFEAQNQVLEATQQVVAQKRSADQATAAFYNASQLNSEQFTALAEQEQTAENELVRWFYEKIFLPQQEATQQQLIQQATVEQQAVQQAVAEQGAAEQAIAQQQAQQNYLAELQNKRAQYFQQLYVQDTAREAVAQNEAAQATTQPADNSTVPTHVAQQPTQQPIVLPATPPEEAAATKGSLFDESLNVIKKQFSPEEQAKKKAGETVTGKVQDQIKDKAIGLITEKLGERAGTVAAAAIPVVGTAAAAASILSSFLPKEIRDFILPAIGGFALKLISSIFTSAITAGSTLIGTVGGFLVGGPVGALIGGSIGYGVGQVANALGVGNILGTGAIGGGAATGASGASSAAAAGSGFHLFGANSGGNVVASGGGFGSSLPIALGSGAIAVCAAATILQPQAGAFLPPLPTISDSGNISKYVTITKKAEPGIKFDKPTDIKYTITLQAKPGYKLTITDAPEDNMTIEINDKENKQGNKNLPPTDKADFTKQVLFLKEITTTPIVLPSYTVPFSTDQVGYSDANISNTFKISFTVQDDNGQSVTENGTSTFTASTAESVCFGKCPQSQNGCWPTDGIIAQLPFGSYDHGKSGEDAFDIAATVNSPVYAPYEGNACAIYDDGYFNSSTDFRPGYGNAIFLTVQPTDGSAPFVLTFGHLNGFEAGIQVNNCGSVYNTSSIDPTKGTHVAAGTMIARVGTTGYSTGYHLHYQYGPEHQDASQAKLASMVPPPTDIGAGVRTCYSPSATP